MPLITTTPYFVEPTNYTLDNVSFVQTFSTSTEDIEPYGVFFKPDGLKMYMSGNQNDKIYEYDLSTPWDISTASFLQDKSIVTQAFTPRNIYIRSDGIKLYLAATGGKDVSEYDLSTPWDISTTSFLQQDTSLPSPQGIFLKPDGLKIFLSQGGGTTGEYNLSVAWDITTNSSLVNSFTAASQDNGTRGLVISADGTTVLLPGTQFDRVYQYSLTTPWSFASVSFVQQHTVSAQNTYPVCVALNNDGSKMFVSGLTPPAIHEYNLT